MYVRTYIVVKRLGAGIRRAARKVAEPAQLRWYVSYVSDTRAALQEPRFQRRAST
jgi:hypothetical protein